MLIGKVQQIALLIETAHTALSRSNLSIWEDDGQTLFPIVSPSGGFSTEAAVYFSRPGALVPYPIETRISIMDDENTILEKLSKGFEDAIRYQEEYDAA